MTIATSGLVFAIHSLDLSKPENTRFQYGSSVFLLSIAAPMAGTCDDATPAMMLATFRPRFLLRLRFGFARRGFVAPRFAAIAFRRAPAREHHVGVLFLARSGHHRGELLERAAVGGAELGREIDVAAELEHAIVVTLEHGLGLLPRELEPLEVFRLVRLERLAVLLLHQRHAEHVDAVALTRAFRIEHEGAGNVVVLLRGAWHRLGSVRRPRVCRRLFSLT